MVDIEKTEVFASLGKEPETGLVALNKKGLPIKTGHKDASKREIRAGDIFVLVRQGFRADARFRLRDEPLARSVYDAGRPRWGSNSYRHRLGIDKDGLTKVRVWKDVTATKYVRKPGSGNFNNVPDPKRVVGFDVFFRPCTFGIVLGRHEHRPSQWHAIIGERHYSVSNQVIQVVRGDEEMDAVAAQILRQNDDMAHEEWFRVIKASLAV